jgi:predicted nuclease with TOPRIM domain
MKLEDLPDEPLREAFEGVTDEEFMMATSDDDKDVRDWFHQVALEVGALRKEVADNKQELKAAIEEVKDKVEQLEKTVKAEFAMLKHQIKVVQEDVFQLRAHKSQIEQRLEELELTAA